jgi:phage shock protein PspC (stress-responsive transcriptional regulator)
MTTNDENPRHEAAFFTSIRGWGITRGDHGVIGGVLEGVGARIGLDRTPARLIGFVLLLITQGLFLVAYAAAWALLPDRHGRIIIQDFGRGTPNVGALIGIAILGIIGTSSWPNRWVSDGHWDWFPFGPLWLLIPLGILAGVIALIIALATRAPKDPHLAGVYAAPPERGSRGSTSASAAASASPSASQPASHPATGKSAQAGDVPPMATAPTPAREPRPRTPGPGAPIYLLALSTAVLAAAALWLLDRDGQLKVSPVVAWFAVAVIIIGAGIVLAGATGRRIGFFGFLAWTFIIGWIIGLAVTPRVFTFADGGATITIDGVAHTIGNGHGWFDQGADGVACGSYHLPPNEIAGATQYVVAPGQTSVTVTSENAVIVVPRDSSLAFRSEGIVDGSLSFHNRDATCTLNRAQGDLYSILRTGETVTVNIAVPDAIIAIEEN